MEIKRTANAGVLLRLDDTSILLDGVCQGVASYLATPPAQRKELTSPWPDVVAFTHTHDDHFDSNYAQQYSRETGRFAFSTGQAAGLLPDYVRADDSFGTDKVTITAVPTRHMGRAFGNMEHRSFVISGSKRLWFLGDATPIQLKEFFRFPKPDVLIVPFPYLATPVSRKQLEALLPCEIVLVHMPNPDNDPEGIWQMTEEGRGELAKYLHCPRMGENLTL